MSAFPGIAGRSGGDLMQLSAQGLLSLFPGRRPVPEHLFHDRPTIEDQPTPFEVGVGPYSSSGPVIETAVKTVTLPSGLVVVGSQIQTFSVWSFSNNNHTKNLRIRMTSGASANNLMFNIVVTSLACASMLKSAMIRATGANGWVENNGGQSDQGGTGSPINTYTVTVPGAITLVFSTQTNNAADTMTLEYYAVWVRSPPP